MKYLCYFFILIGMSGCSLSPIHEDPLSTYHLTASGKPAKACDSAKVFATNSVNETLMLSPMEVNPGFDTSSMMYSYASQPNKLYHFANNVWVAPPAQMLLPLMAMAIQQQCAYKAVVIPPYIGISDEVLSTRLLYLKQNFSDKQHSEVEAAIEATLIDSRSHKVLWTRVFSQTEPNAGSNPASGVHAMNRLVHDLLSKIAGVVKIGVS
jgi:cholesterol transport system auxiliary component